jgi:hypothetical protein
MPFFLVHGVEAVLPVKITHEAPRISSYDEDSSNGACKTMSMRWTKPGMWFSQGQRNISRI